MSKPAAAADATDAVPAKGKKKLIIIVAALVLVLAGGGGAALFVIKQKAAAAAAAAAAEEEEDEEGGGEHRTATAAAPAKAPTFVPLDPFVVNLADRESDRFAQIAITFQIADPTFAEQIKVYMPAIRNNILMILAQKTSQQLLERSGKEALAEEIRRESVRPMGIDIPVPPAAGASAAVATSGDDLPPPRRRKAPPANPIQQVHFANFIIQ